MDGDLDEFRIYDRILMGSQIESLAAQDAPEVVETGHKLRLVSGKGDTHNKLFEIRDGNLYAKRTFDYETENELEVRIRATDAGKLNFEDTVTISVLNRNDSPTSITATKLEVAENLTGADVGSFNVADPDGDSVGHLELTESFDGLVLHLAADAIRGLAYGDAVNEWSDSSLEANHINNVTGDPQWIEDGLNGRPVVRFDGNDYMWTTRNFDYLEEYTIFTVARYTGGDSERVISSNSRNWLFGFHGNRTGRWYAEGWICESGPSDTNWHLHSGHINSSADPEASFWRDGVLLVSGIKKSSNFDYKPGQIALGAFARNKNETSKCEVAEVILFDSVLIEDDRQLVEDWLQAKYDLDGTGGTYHQYSLVSGEGDNDNDSFTLFGNQLQLGMAWTSRVVSL